MKKLRNKGFSAVEGLLLVVLVALIAGIGYYVYNQSQKQDATSKPQSSAQTKVVAYEKTTTVPDSWKKYSNAEYKISFAYPGNWFTSDYTFDKKKGKDEQNVFSVNATKIFVICLKEKEDAQTCNAQININNQSLEDSMKELRQYYKDLEEDHTEKNIIFDGNPAVEVTTGKQKEYYVSAHGGTYALTTVHKESDTKIQNLTPEESLQLFESIEIE